MYAAIDDRLDRPVAIKTLREPAADPAGRARLEREARAAARVNHPNICQLDVGDDSRKATGSSASSTPCKSGLSLIGPHPAGTLIR